MKSQISAYSNAINIVASDREVEANALTKAAQFLYQVIANPNDREFMEEAISVNNRIWALLVQGATCEESVLSDQLQAAVVSLSIYISKTSLSILAGADVAKLQSVININREIASGLRTTT